MQTRKLQKNAVEITTDFLDSINDYIQITLERIGNDYYLNDDGRTLMMEDNIDEEEIGKMLSKLKQTENDIILDKGRIRMKVDPMSIINGINVFTRAIAIVDYSVNKAPR